MIQNYMTIAWRNLLKHRTFSLINIGGLGLGMAVSMLILLYVSHELSFDRFHAKADRIFSTLMKMKMGETDLQMNLLAPDFGQRIKEGNPEVAEYVRIASEFRESPTIKSEEGRQFMEPRFYFADPSIFRVFSFSMRAGDAASALDGQESVVISEPMARKYFGEADPIGKTLIYNKKELLRVTGVFEKMPTNSSLQFDFIAALPVFEKIMRRDNPGRAFESNPTCQTWFLLDRAASREKVERVIPTLLPKSEDPILNSSTFVLSPLTDMHLGDNWGDFSNQKYLSVFLAVAALVLFLALFNYMNLATARASIRAREVGVRKVLGAHGGHLRGQFYGESALITALGFGFGLALFALFRPTFYKVLGLDIDESFLSSPLFISVLGGLFLLSTFVAGSYPAVLLSRFSPVQIIKGDSSAGRSGGGVRRILMVTQFAVSTALIIASLGIRAQIEHMQSRNIGLNRDQVLVLPLTKGLGAHFPAFRAEVQAQTGVQNVSVASFAFFQGGWDMWFVKSPTTREELGINALRVDEHFFETLEIAWKTPPANPRELASKRQLVINESAIEALKITGDPLGQRIETGDPAGNEIVGVTKDFNFVGLQRKIEGMLIAVVPDSVSMAGQGGHLYLRLDPGADLAGKIAAIGQIFKKYEAEAAFDYYFLDEAFDNQYRAEKRMAWLFSGFTGVALLLACLGLLGLATFTAERRTKEIGIRKVLGASVASLAGLLTRDFLLWVAVAAALAAPAAWYFLQRWLADFAYRVDIQWWMFALAGLGAVAVALLTVGLQSVKAALANPVDTLRNE